MVLVLCLFHLFLLIHLILLIHPILLILLIHLTHLIHLIHNIAFNRCSAYWHGACYCLWGSPGCLLCQTGRVDQPKIPKDIWGDFILLQPTDILSCWSTGRDIKRTSHFNGRCDRSLILILILIISYTTPCIFIYDYNITSAQ